MLATNKLPSEIFNDLIDQLKEKKEPSLFLIHKDILPVTRLTVSIPLNDPLSWLAKQSYYPKAYFQDAETNCLHGALGSIFSTESFPSIKAVKQTEASSIRLFGGMEFFNQPRKTRLWKNFSPCNFFLPMIEIEKNPDECLFHLNVITPHFGLSNYKGAIETIISSLDFSSSAMSFSMKKPISRVDFPSFQEWEKNLKDCLQQIRSHCFEKVVVARQTSFEFPEILHPLYLLKKLSAKMVNSTLFAFQFAPAEAFIGMTPEILYKRDGSHVESVAIAGTRPWGNKPIQDQKYCKELVENDKENREFLIVGNFLKQMLTKLCDSLKTGSQNKVLQTGTVQHLYEVYKGILKAEVVDSQIISAIHPTPAMGGYPKDAALQYLYHMETFDRGWYASPIGWITPEQSNFYVGIRSALVQEKTLHAFAGAGIVEGSIPEKEWEELDLKISHFITKDL